MRTKPIITSMLGASALVALAVRDPKTIVILGDLDGPILPEPTPPDLPPEDIRTLPLNNTYYRHSDAKGCGCKQWQSCFACLMSNY